MAGDEIAGFLDHGSHALEVVEADAGEAARKDDETCRAHSDAGDAQQGFVVGRQDVYGKEFRMTEGPGQYGAQNETYIED